MTRDEMIAEVRRRRLIEQVKAKRAQQTAPPEPAPRSEAIDTLADVQGFGQRLLKGQTLGFGDEIAGVGRAALDYVMPNSTFEGVEGADQSFADRYRMYRDDARAVDEQFQEKNPGTAFVAELAGGIASPASLVAPGVGTTGSAGARLGQAVARGGAEGAVYGLGEGEGDVNAQLASAATGGATGGVASGVIGGLGGALGRTLSKRRVEPDLRQPDGGFMPIHLADPESGLGRLYRDWIASVPFAKGALKAQEEPFLTRAATEVADQEQAFTQQAKNLKRHQWHRANDIDLAAQQEAERLQGLMDIERLNAAQARDTAAAVNARAAAEESALTRRANEALNLDTLKAAVPEGRRDAVTATGHTGFRQALEQINAAYDDAWGTISGLRKGTIPALLDMASWKADTLPADSAAKLKRLANDIEKLGDADNVAGIDDKLRRMINTEGDFQLMKDLKEMRETLRMGLPDENAAKLQDVDKVYPAFLATQKAAAKAAESGGVPTRKQVLTAATSVAGERRAAKGEIPLIDQITGAQVPDIAATTVMPKRPALERSVSLAREKRAASAAASAERKQAAVIADAEKAALAEVKKSGPLARAKAAQDTLERAKSSPHSTAFSALASTGALGSAVTGGLAPYAVGLGAGVGVARGLASKAGQEFVAGQREWQKALAEALRKGDTAKYTQLLSRFAAGQVTGD